MRRGLSEAPGNLEQDNNGYVRSRLWSRPSPFSIEFPWDFLGKTRRPAEAGSSNVQPLSVREFFARFPDDDACLKHVMEVRYGLRHPCDKCLHLSTFHRLANRLKPSRLRLLESESRDGHAGTLKTLLDAMAALRSQSQLSKWNWLVFTGDAPVVDSKKIPV